MTQWFNTPVSLVTFYKELGIVTLDLLC
jgi:hypothetical protein